MKEIMEKDQKKDQSNIEDKLTNAIGEFGRWQVLMLVIVLCPTKISAGWYQMGIIFIAPNTTFVCAERNSSGNVEINTCYNDCVKYDYHTDFGNTIISQWDLICERDWMANFTQTIVMFGVLLGSILFGYIADRYGRRPALLSAAMLQLVTAMAEAFCPTYWTFTIVRLFLGISTAGTLLSAFSFIIEITGPRKRELIACLGAIPIPFGEMILPIFSYFLRTYDMFCLGIAVPAIIYLSYFYIMPESPKWLISMGKLEEASKVMKQGAKWNNLPSENMIDVAKTIANEELDASRTKHEPVSYLHLVTNKTLRIRTICSCVTWFSLGITYYGSNQYIGQTSSNVFISIALAGALQIPGIILASILCKYVGRRITIMSFFAVCALSNALSAVPNECFYFKMIVQTIAVSCAAGAFSSAYLFSSELFPTVARNMALGACSTISRVGSMLAPFVAGLAVTASWLPLVIFAVVPVIAAIASYCLPETRGKKLPDYLV